MFLYNFNILWEENLKNTEFKAYSIDHISILIFVFIIILLIFIFKEHIKNYSLKYVIRFILIFLFIGQQCLLYLWYINTGTFSISTSLPLYTCRICEILCLILLINKNRKVFSIAFFWGIVGATIALLSPDTEGYKFPSAMYLQFFIGHGCILITLFFAIFIYEYIPDLKDLKIAFKHTFIYLFVVGILNYMIDGNYSYLRAKPTVASPLDSLPPYPFYIPMFVGFILLMFIMVYMPFYF